jgi:hypothetical protein
MSRPSVVALSPCLHTHPPGRRVGEWAGAFSVAPVGRSVRIEAFGIFAVVVRLDLRECGLAGLVTDAREVTRVVTGGDDHCRLRRGEAWGF